MGGLIINDIHGYDSIYTDKNSSKILLNFVEVAKGIEKIFKKFKPDVVFIPNGLSNIDVTIIESLSKYYKIRFLTPETFRYDNYFFFCNNLKNETLKIKESYFRTKKKFKDNKKLNQIYKRLTSKKNSVSADARETKKTLDRLNKKIFLEIILGSVLYAILKQSLLFYIIFIWFKNFSFKIYI